MGRSNRSRQSPGRRDRRRPAAGRAVVGGVPARPRPALKAGQLHCPACGNAVTPTVRGNLRAHQDLFGNPCLNKAAGRPAELDTLPEVVLPPAPKQTSTANVTTTPGAKKPSRLDVGSLCQACGKWIPGERRLCGRCFATGGRTR